MRFQQQAILNVHTKAMLSLPLFVVNLIPDLESKDNTNMKMFSTKAFVK